MIDEEKVNAAGDEIDTREEKEDAQGHNEGIGDEIYLAAIDPVESKDDYGGDDPGEQARQDVLADFHGGIWLIW
jgi:hypothetical protein